MAVELKHLAPESLKPAVYNPRKIGEVERAALTRGIAEFGMIDPIVCRAEDLLVLGGHQRLSVAIELGLESVPVALVPGLSDDRAAALNILLNNPRAQGAWDMKALADILSELDGHGFDATLTGFDETELEGLLTWTPDPGEPVEEGDVDLTPPKRPESKLGEVYQLGRHRLMCGDATNQQHIDALLAGNVPQMAYNDPPYGISIVQGGWVGGGEANNIPFGGVPKGETPAQRRARLGTVGGSKPFGSRDVRGTDGSSNIVKVNRYAPVIGDESTETAISAYNLCARLKITVLIFWGGNYYASALPSSSCWIVWDKENTGNFADAELAWTNQKTAVRIFRHMWNGMLKASERGERRVAPTQKPIALAAWCLQEYGKPGDGVLDLFGGSGSTLIACEQTNRTAYLMEIDPGYCDVIRRRYEAYVSQKQLVA